LPLRGAKGLLAVHTDAQCGEFLLEEWLINPVRSILRQRNRGCVREAGNAETRPRPVGRLFDQPGTDRIAEHIAQDREEMDVLLNGKDFEPSLPHVPMTNERSMTTFLLYKSCLTRCALALAFALVVSPAQAGNEIGVPLAEVNGQAVTAEDLDHALGVKLTELQEQLYELKRAELDALIAQRLLAQEAAKRGVSVAALLDAEVTAKVGLVTETEIEAVYQENKSRSQGNESEFREKIRASLQQRKLAAQREQFVQVLRAQGTVVDRLQPPPVVRVQVSTDGAPIRGTADAPVTLVEFSDFHCPFCKRVQPTLTQVLEKYPGKVRLLFRHLPLDALHPQARNAAEASWCAQDQGKFWEFHDLLFANAPKAAQDDLKHYAEQIDLDMKTFESCLSQNTHRDSIQRDIDEVTKLGMSGTPAFFINGRPLSGAQPLEKFAQVIDEELALAVPGVPVSALSLKD